MKKKIYGAERPPIPADVRRSVEVEAGHSCTVKNCTEHTYLEIHHINETERTIASATSSSFATNTTKWLTKAL